MRVAIGSNHGGFELKEAVKTFRAHGIHLCQRAASTRMRALSGITCWVS